MPLLAEKVILVTGGLSVTGRAASARLASEGAQVILADRDIADAPSHEGEAMRCHVDAMAPDSVETLLSTVMDRFGRIDCLVQAGAVPYRSSFLQMQVAAFDEVVAANLKSVFIVAQAVAKAMHGTGGGSIVNVAGLPGIVADAEYAAYSAAMGGVIHLSKIMAVDLAQYGIRVNVVAPGPIEGTHLAENCASNERNAWQQRISLSRFADPEEVAASIAFLCSSASSYMTGQLLAVDGGFTTAGMRGPTARPNAEASIS